MLMTFWIKRGSKIFSLDKEQIIANTELAAQLFSGFWYTHTKLLCCSILPISAWILESALRVSGLAGFHSISPAGHLLAWGRGEQEREVINGRKMAAVCSINPKAFRVEHGCLSSSEEWVRLHPIQH